MIMNMETYLRRTYAKRAAKQQQQEDFPFWDYRSRRGTLARSGSSISSRGSYSDGSSISSVSSKSDSTSENASVLEHSDTDSLLPWEQHKMMVQFQTDIAEIPEMERVYQPVINWIDSDLHILKITDKSECVGSSCHMKSLPDNNTQIPSMALMVFLHEEGMLGFERVQTLKRYFEKAPWKFHHSEQVQRDTINPYPYNSQEFYYTSEDLPLWAVRQVHTGKQFFRMVLFVSERSWQSMIQFYKLILSDEPDIKREDFCLFTVSSFPNFDLQLALKKLKGDTVPRVLESVRIQFFVKDIGNIVSLLPNVCRPLSDNRWETTDTEGNLIVLETPRNPSNSTFNDVCQSCDNNCLSAKNSFNRDCMNRRINTRYEDVYSSDSPLSKVPRSRSLISKDKIMEKIKNENLLYRENTMNAIKDKHLELQKQLPVLGPSDCGFQESCGESDSMKSFYV